MPTEVVEALFRQYGIWESAQRDVILADFFKWYDEKQEYIIHAFNEPPLGNPAMTALFFGLYLSAFTTVRSLKPKP